MRVVLDAHLKLAARVHERFLVVLRGPLSWLRGHRGAGRSCRRRCRAAGHAPYLHPSNRAARLRELKGSLQQLRLAAVAAAASDEH